MHSNSYLINYCINKGVPHIEAERMVSDTTKLFNIGFVDCTGLDEVKVLDISIDIFRFTQRKGYKNRDIRKSTYSKIRNREGKY